MAATHALVVVRLSLDVGFAVGGGPRGKPPTEARRPDHVIKHQVILSAEQRVDLGRVTRQSSVGVAKKRWA
ncbi:MAG TPA: hypothetical protein VH092_05295, partial [Urbifossiella sp.]|nr:hypothetical protein [Urbifossiella sp.]